MSNNKMDIEPTNVDPAAAANASVVDPEIFESVQKQIDEDSQLRDELKGYLKSMDRQARQISSILSRAHSVPSSALPQLVASTQSIFAEQKVTIGQLAEAASKYPYYKYNNIWTRDIQNAVFAVIFARWLVGKDGKQGELMTIEEVGEALGIPVNIKDRDTFHLTIEEYLQSIITLIEELSRLAVNSVTLGDYQRPMLISRFVKDLHSAFQVLNLKNDILRRRSDGIKYNVKKIEDVVYDLSLRNLVPSKQVEVEGEAGKA
ncbi:Translin [Terfezia boudieri ATCC MYA-4762]|uniref:Translin n=1 Tax=Terfezia boudieri ATCC MYA-4762 TaxID=1051890 RepID=A0A3N4LIL4_9PEZI|nr:Translin [Terfezia boudieri ATCC MYA-4762]